MKEGDKVFQLISNYRPHNKIETILRIHRKNNIIWITTTADPFESFPIHNNWIKESIEL